MLIAEFDFELPTELIATRPASPRDTARLLLVTEGLRSTLVRDLPALLRPRDLLVMNDTRVIPAQLQAWRGEARIELTLHQQAGPGRWRAFARPARKLRPGDRLMITADFAATVESRDGAEVSLDFACDDDTLAARLARHGSMPLPPYIRKLRPVDDRDRKDYQTVLASRDGAVAAPTAGLHFTGPLLDRLAAAGVARATLTLHVGAGTFLPVKVADTRDHRMHGEWGEIDADTAARINRARASGGRIVAVGTTSLRLLESAAAADGRIEAFSGETDIFITPGYQFRAVDLLLTNFHLPKSTLYMLVCAFAGMDRMAAAYDHAKAARYRFYSYGDASLLAPPGVEI